MDGFKVVVRFCYLDTASNITCYLDTASNTTALVSCSADGGSKLIKSITLNHVHTIKTRNETNFIACSLPQNQSRLLCTSPTFLGWCHYYLLRMFSQNLGQTTSNKKLSSAAKFNRSTRSGPVLEWSNGILAPGLKHNGIKLSQSTGFTNCWNFCISNTWKVIFIIKSNIFIKALVFNLSRWVVNFFIKAEEDYETGSRSLQSGILRPTLGNIPSNSVICIYIACILFLHIHSNFV